MIITPAVSLLIGIVTIVTSFIVTKLNIAAAQINLDKQLTLQREALDTQMKVQIATTFEKEWIENVRSSLGRIGKLTDGFIEIDNSDENEVQYDKLMELYTATIQENFILSLYLNPKRPYEKSLIDALNKLGEAVEPSGRRDFQTIENLQDRVLEAAHDLFDSRVPKL